MKLPTLLLLVLVLFLPACSSGDDDEGPTPTTSVGTPSATASPSPPAEPSPSATPDASPTQAPAETPDPNETPQSGSTINAENFATLALAFDAVFETPEYMAWQQDGRLLVASRGEASLIDPANGDVTTAYSGAGQEYVLALSRQGLIATAEAGNMGITIRDLAGNIASRLELPAQFGSAGFSSDGARLAVSRLDLIEVDIWNVADGSLDSEITGFETAAPVYSGRFGPGDASIIWTSRATVQVSDLATGALRPPLEHEQFVSSVAVPSAGNTLVTTWGTFATLWDVETGERIRDLDQFVSAFEAALVPGAELLMVATDEGVNLWDTATYENVATLDAPARQIDVSDDGRYLATLNQDGYLQVFAPRGR